MRDFESAQQNTLKNKTDAPGRATVVAFSCYLAICASFSFIIRCGHHDVGSRSFETTLRYFCGTTPQAYHGSCRQSFTVIAR
jgi:hypothetical protein